MKPSSKTEWIDIVLTAIGTLGIVAIFAPFDWGVSPLSAAFMGAELTPYAVPFVLAIPTAVTSAAGIAKHRVTRREQMLCYALSALSATATFWGVVTTVIALLNGEQPLVVWIIPDAIAVATLTAGFFLTSRLAQRQTPSAPSHIVAMQVPFIANALMLFAACSFSTSGSLMVPRLDFGAYLTLVACTAYAVQMRRAFARDTGALSMAEGQ